MEEDEKREALCSRIWQACRAELCDVFPYLDGGFSCLQYQTAGQRGFRVDGTRVFFHPEDLIRLYAHCPNAVRRGCLHMLLHCLFLHLDAPGDCDVRLWNLACDIAVEQMIESEEAPRLSTGNAIKRDFPRLLGEKHRSARQIVGFLRENAYSASFEELEAAFSFDDHSHWKDSAGQGQKDRWERLLSAAAGKKAAMGKRGHTPGGGEETLSASEPGQFDYRTYLSRFTVPREEVQLDPESFDYGFYHFGMAHYGSMPLIEPLEYQEVRRLEELVIAIDTSGSCSAETVSRFLAETYAILAAQENFFRKMKVYFLQCDCIIQDVTLIQSREDWLNYAKKIRIQGRGGTDFGPVFDYVQKLRQEKELKNLKALLYFTDGDGAYPSSAPDYETAFVLLKETGHPELVPKWGKLLLI